MAAEIAKGSFVLSKDDIVELGSRVRHMGIIDFARAVKLYYATQKRGTILIALVDLTTLTRRF